MYPDQRIHEKVILNSITLEVNGNIACSKCYQIATQSQVQEGHDSHEESNERVWQDIEHYSPADDHLYSLFFESSYFDVPGRAPRCTKS